MTKEEYVILYEKWVSGTCTPQETLLFEQYQDEFSLEDADWKSAQEGEQDAVIDEIHQRVMRTIRRNRKIKTVYLIRLSAAASILLLLGFFIELYFFQHGNTKQKAADVAVTNTILPGQQRATLTLADGSQIILTDSLNGIISNQGAAVITKTKDGKLIYDLSKSTASAAGSLQYNSLKTPRGGEYQLILPDGSKVWLNAASELRFPAAFQGKERRVELSGEAYFEVAKNRKMPFHVITRRTDVEVLGTHFNIDSYTAAVNTTLLEGAVKLQHEANQLILKSGQSGIQETEGSFRVMPADLEAVTAWKNGYFVFHDEPLKAIMEKVSRWYDVDIEYQAGAAKKEFYGKVSRYNTIDELLKNLELTGMVHFKILPPAASGKGRRILVMP